MSIQNTNSSARPTVQVAAAAFGAEVIVSAAGAGQLALNFDPSDASMSRSGNDLIFDIDGGGTVTIRSFFEVGEEPLPSFVLGDGTLVASADLLAANDIDVTPAAAATAMGGLRVYDDDAGSLMGGLDALDKLGQFRWAPTVENTDEFDPGRYPGGSFGLGIATNIGGAFSAYAYEDARPLQHQGNNDINAARITMNLSPDSGSSVGEIRLSGFPAGAKVYLGDPSTGSAGNAVLLTPGLNGVYTFGASDFSGSGVYVIPPANSDNDFDINVSVDFTNSGRTASIGGTFTVLVDAVADQPVITGYDFVANANDTHHMSQNSVQKDLFEDGYNKQDVSVESDASKNEGKVEVSLKVTSIFGDYTDGSETHYVLVEKLPGFESAQNYQIYTDANGDEYFMVPADGAIDPATGKAEVTVTLTTTSYSHDTNFTVKTGSMAVDKPTDSDFDPTNNESVVIEGSVNFNVDVIDSVLSMQMGWASESNKSDKHLPSGPHNADYANMGDYHPTDGQVQPGVDPNSTGGNGAPITISISNDPDGSSAESITEIKLTVEAGRGDLVNGAGMPYTYVSNGDGTVTYTFSNVGAALNGVYFRPASGSNDHGDISVKYEISVENGKGATASYSGTSTIVVDAVADRADVTVETDGSQVDYNKNMIGGVSVEQGAAKPGEAVTLHSKVSFPDTDGLEEHFVLIEAGSENANANGNHYACSSYSINGGAAVAITASTPTEVINGVTYYRIDVGGTTGTVNVSVNVTGEVMNNADTTHDVTIGGLSTVTGSDKEYDLDNNRAINLDKSVSFDVAPANSGEDLDTKNTYEANAAGIIDPNKHGVTGTLTVKYGSATAVKYGPVSGYDLGTVGDVTFSLDGGGDSAELFTGITFTVQGDLSQLGTLTLKGAGDATLSTSYDSNTGLTTVTIVDATPNMDNIVINFKPAAYSDADLKIMSYELDFINSRSHAAGKITENGNGAQPVDKVVVDAVAAKATNLTANNIDYVGAQTQAKAGEEVKVDFSMKVPDVSDANEAHGLTLKVAGTGGYNSVTLHGGTGGDLVITFDNPISSGQFAGNVMINGSLASGLTVQLVTINNVSYYKISGSAFESYLQQVNGNVDGTIDFNAAATGTSTGGGDYKNSSTVGMLVEDVESDNSGVDSKNNASYSEKSYTYNVAGVGSVVGTVSVTSAYENAHGNAHVDYKDRSELSVNDLKAGGSRITVPFTKNDSDESITKAVFVVDYKNAANAGVPGQFMYKGQLVELPGSVPGSFTDAVTGITCTVTADGRVIVEIPNFEPADASGDNLYFIPGHNYSNEDLTLDYSVTVHDSSSNQDKVFTNIDAGANPPHTSRDYLLPDANDISDNHIAVADKGADNGKAIGIVVDAVAQNPDIDAQDTIAKGELKPGGDPANPDDYFEQVVPGKTVNIDIAVDFHGDTTDSSQHHYVFVERQPGWSLQTDSSGKVVLMVDGVACPAVSVAQQYMNGTTYWRIEVSNSDLPSGGSATITVPVTTPADSNDAIDLKVGAGSWEDISKVQTGGDKETNIDNNVSYSETGKVTIEFDKSSSASVGAGNGYYEQSTPNANLNPGDYAAADMKNPAVPITITPPSNSEDKVTAVSITPEADTDKGTMYVFDSVQDYQDYLDAYADYVTAYNAYVNDATGTLTEPAAPSVTDYGATALTGKTSIEVNPDGSFKEPVVFVPNSGKHGDGDYEFKYDIETKSDLSGDTWTNSATGKIVGDAVAQRPEMTDNNNSDIAEGHGKPATFTVGATFTDIADSSTEHYILVEVEPNWTMTYDGVNALGQPVTYTLGFNDIVIGPDGVSYYKIPVNTLAESDRPYNSGNDTLTANVTVNATTPPHVPGVSDTGSIKTGAMSYDKTSGDSELTWHNNYAFAEGKGVGYDNGGHGGGSSVGIWVSDLYENNAGNDYELPGHAADGAETPGSMVINYPSHADSSVVLTVDAVDGKAPLDIFDAAGNPITPVYNNGTDTYSYTINKVDGSATSETIKVTVSDDYAHRSEDINITYEFHRGANGNGQITGNGSHLAIVDAVAQAGDIDEVNSYDASKAHNHADNAGYAVAGDNSGNKSATFKVTAEFHDTDGSEAQYVLVEQIPGWVVKGAADTISVTMADGSSKTFYRIDVTAESKLNGGNVDIEVTVEHDPNAVSQLFAGTDNGTGVFTYDLATGTMTYEKNSGTGGNYELTTENNASIVVDGTAHVAYSPLDSNISITTAAKSMLEHDGAVTDGSDEMALKLNGLATGKNDQLDEITFTYDDTKGDLYLDGVKVLSGTTITNAGELQAIIDGKLSYKPNKFEYDDPKINWNYKISDKVSGDEHSSNGSTVIKIDAVADGSDNDMSAGNLAGTHGAVESGQNALITVETDFIDMTAGSEEHWVVLEQDLDYALVGVKINGISCNASDIVTKFDQDGKPYYAVQVSGKNDTVVFEVKTPETDHDISNKLNAGTISISAEAVNQTDVSLNNNWTENISQVSVNTGVLETASVTLGAAAGVEEGGFSQLTFSGVELGYNETATITITALSGGYGNGLLYYHDGSDYVPVAANPDGSYTLVYSKNAGGQMSFDKPYFFAAPEHASGNYNIKYSVVVTDNASGESLGFSTQTSSVKILGVADAGALDQADYTSAQTGAHTAQANITATFEDTDGSEGHYLIFKMPDGMSVSGSAALDSGMIAALGLPAGGNYYYVQLDGTAGSLNYTANFVADGQSYNPASDNITVWTCSMENADYAAGKQFALSASSTISVGDLNLEPVAGAASVSGIAADENWSAMGDMNLAAMFNDVDGDTLSYSFKHNGTDYDLGANGVDIAGTYGTLHVNADGTYTYEPNAGQSLDSAILEDFNITVTATDGHGGSATNSAQISLTSAADHIYGTAGDDTITGAAGGVTLYGGAGNDVIYGGSGNDTIYAGSGNNFIYGGQGNDVMHSGTGNDTFAWNQTDLQNGGIDQILNFDVSSDKLFFEGLFTSGDAQQDIASLLGNDLTVSMSAADQLSINYKGQNVELTLGNSVSDDVYNGVNSADAGDAESAKVSLLMQILTNSGI